MILGNSRPSFPGRTRHKVFISYFHRDDECCRNEFERRYGHLFISKSVQPGDIASDLSSDYIKRLIREGYITYSSVVVVLIGPNTRLRKHVDWEISAGLSKKVRGYSGLVGFLLPSFPLQTNPLTGRFEYRFSDLPDRLADNVRSGYAQVYLWPGFNAPDGYVNSALETAFVRRITHSHLIWNSRHQMHRNRPDQNLDRILSSLFGHYPSQ
jgi:hypothetical protein